MNLDLDRENLCINKIERESSGKGEILGIEARQRSFCSKHKEAREGRGGRMEGEKRCSAGKLSSKD